MAFYFMGSIPFLTPHVQYRPHLGLHMYTMGFTYLTFKGYYRRLTKSAADSPENRTHLPMNRGPDCLLTGSSASAQGGAARLRDFRLELALL
jgi:hypothetical protein